MAQSSDRNIMQIMILDQGIIQFNAKPRDGISFLIKNKVISDDTLEIAKFLATTDKLDKHVLGNFLGKDNDFSIAILNRFASLFHYENVPFDIALRSFTNRFAMPGESQMIYRILERFALYYSQSNPHLDKDKALILSYALIMLNVDLHSSRVKAKMTREEFVRNTELALGSAIRRDELEQMYTRISEKELKPDTSAEEIVYSKLAVNPKYSAKAAVQSGEASAQVIEILKNGAILLKYGREGTPHPRKLFLSSDGKRLCWIDPHKLEKLEKRQMKKVEKELMKKPSGDLSNIPKSGGFLRSCFPSKSGAPVSNSFDAQSLPTPKAGELVKHGANDLDILRAAFIKIRSSGVVASESFRREIPLEDITGLVVGTGGTRNLRRHFESIEVDDAETEQRCFSIITDYRTLDLQAPAGVDIQPWLHFFHSVLSEREKRLRALADKNRDIWSFTQKERASLVRWQEIVPQWAEHWNCGARVSAGGGFRASQHPKEELLNHKMFFVNPSGFVLDRGQRLETAVSPQIVALWLEGIPSSVRPRVWPIAASNALRLDDDYFGKLVESLISVDVVQQDINNVSLMIDNQMDQSVTESVFYNISTSVANPSTPQGKPGVDFTAFAPASEASLAAKFEKELERELNSSSMRKFANRALTWIDARGSREQQAFFKPSQELAELTRKWKRAKKSLVSSPTVSQRMAPDEAQDAGLYESNEDAKSEGSWDSNISPMNSGWENVYLATKLLVSAFLTQRKDIKYVRGMAVLASMVIFNVGIHDLSRTFSVYSNLLHQHYFFDFFTMRWRDMRMRFDLYGKLLRERIPYLDDHFNAIQITSDLYFNQWLLTGFTRVLPFRTACRVWDGFLLLGESFFFTAALALLNYYEHSLMTSGFSGCLEILLGHADEVLFNDKKFFDCVHTQSVSNERFAAWISAQRLAEEKTALYDLLLLM